MELPVPQWAFDERQEALYNRIARQVVNFARWRTVARGEPVPSLWSVDTTVVVLDDFMRLVAAQQNWSRDDVAAAITWCSRDETDTHHRMELVGLEHSYAVFVLVSDRRQGKGKGKGKGRESKGKGQGSDGHGPSGSGHRDPGDGRIVSYRPY